MSASAATLRGARALLIASLVAGCAATGDGATSGADGGASALDASEETADLGGPDRGAADGGHPGAPDASAPGDAGGPGFVVYRSADDGHLYRIEATPGAAPVDLSAALDALSPGADDWINVSPAGRWYLVGTERFGCDGWPCVVRVPASLDAHAVVTTPDGEPLHADFSAVSDDGGSVVYPEVGDERVDLFVISRTAGRWGAPRPLTAGSPFVDHGLPALSPSGESVLLTCGDTPYAQARTGICEVGLDGAGFRRVVEPTDGPGGTPESSVRAPDYLPDGSIVFEADWSGGEQIWRWPPGGGATDELPVRLAPAQWDDNSPCALGDGRVASLWLDRPGGEGDHELKITGPDGAWFLAVQGVDVADIGMGCAR